jgi:hypothetical protein
MKNKIWNADNAAKYMIMIANDLIKDGVFASEGGRLLHAAMHDGKCHSVFSFKETLKSILEWDDCQDDKYWRDLDWKNYFH